MRQQREQLHCLPQPHVVGQDAAQPGAVQEVQPRQAAGLVRTQLPGERLRRLDRRESLLGPPGQQFAEPAVGLDALDRRVLRSRADAKADTQQLADRRLPTTPDQLERSGAPACVQLDPLAAKPDHRRLPFGQLGQLVGGQRLAADGDVVAEVGEGIETECGVPGVDLSRLAGRRCDQPKPEPGGRLIPPARQLYAEAGRSECRSRRAEEPVGVLGVQRKV